MLPDPVRRGGSVHSVSGSSGKAQEGPRAKRVLGILALPSSRCLGPSLWVQQEQFGSLACLGAVAARSPGLQCSWGSPHPTRAVSPPALHSV